ncbi:hypothetical protein F5878DRAFT_640970 [Lentinula raphanica]|uniref:Uncharacterized protein n=1 Tax=Lentinula raphanica TaxID=153919 RepID=A0AA38PB60_9AGAR|nr:hypothetical protein F5878DRAFT_640970 [Lentinula raphanica]
MGMRLVRIVFGNNFGVTSILVLPSTLPSLLDASCLLETYANESPKQMYRDELRWKSNDLFLIVFNDAATHRRHKFATGGAWRSIGQILGHFIVRTNLCGPWGMSLYLRRADNLSQWTAHSIDFIVSRDGTNQGGHFTFSDERKLPWNSNSAFDFESVFRQRKSICMISQVGLLPAVAAAAHGRYMVASIRMVLDL